jgi:DNA-binding response OmpR family regulator
MPKRILLVEDTIDLRVSLRELLVMEDYLVIESANGEEATVEMEKNAPDLIITDILMPQMNGFDFIKFVRKNTKWTNVPILVFSATPSRENEKKVLELGANVYLQKQPSTLDTLVNIVNKLIKDE